MKQRIVAVIPARYGSTRFPGKPLAPILGKSMVEWVYRRAWKCTSLERVLVATDDERIYDAVQAFGGEALMTAPHHPTGTDRLAEVAQKVEGDIFINIQGDEPLVRCEMLEALIGPFLKENPPAVTTLATDVQMGDLEDPHRVKVVTDVHGRALYFSRAPIPFPWEKGGARPLLHQGFYAFGREFLLTYPLLPRTPLEERESLEQLRVVEHGYSLQVVYTPYRTQGVDRPSDLSVVTMTLKEEEL